MKITLITGATGGLGKAFAKLYFERKKAALSVKVEKLEAMSPLRVLQRGYCVAENGDGALTSAKSAKIGSPLLLTFSDGRVSAIVDKKEI